MPRSLSLIALAASLFSGCAMCSSEGDYNYGMYGGSWERLDPCRGRVGSAFYEAGAPVRASEEEVLGTPQEPTPTPEPAPRRYTPDELHTEEARRPSTNR